MGKFASGILLISASVAALAADSNWRKSDFGQEFLRLKGDVMIYIVENAGHHSDQVTLVENLRAWSQRVQTLAPSAPEDEVAASLRAVSEEVLRGLGTSNSMNTLMKDSLNQLRRIEGKLGYDDCDSHMTGALGAILRLGNSSSD